MVSIFTPDLLTSVATPSLQSALAVLCRSAEWGPLEEQTLALASGLRQSGRVVRLIVRAGSPLHEQAQARQLPCYALPGGWQRLRGGLGGALARWLRREQLPVLLTTHAADLPLASYAKWWRGDALRLVHRQLAPLPETNFWQAWWTARQTGAVDAWLAPLPGLARQVLARTSLKLPRLWVVPPALPAEAALAGCGSRAEARRLLDLPAATALVGVLDCGDDGPAFAVEALYRLRHEARAAVELVVMGGPATPPDDHRWVALRQLARQLRLNHRLHLRPLHTSATPTLFYQALDVLLLPAASNATGLPLLGAMASGCPLVSVAAPDALDVLEEGRTAHLFPAGDVAACAQALLTTLRSASSRRTAQQTARLVRQQCSPAQQAQQIEAILQYICRHEVLTNKASAT